MIIERCIGGVDLHVDVNTPNDIYFEEEFLLINGINSCSLSPVNICEIIAKESFIPMVLTWEIIDKCSFNCPFCYIVSHSFNDVHRFKAIETRLKDIVDRGLFYCLLTGGEPLLHPDFISIYTFLKTSGVLVELYTNAALITDKHLDLFKKYPPFRIEITIYGISQSIFSKNTATSGYLSTEILNNIVRLKESGLNVVCKTPINNLTVREFDEIKCWCELNNIEFYFSTSVFQGYDGADLQHFSCSDDLIVAFDTLQYKIKDKNHIRNCEIDLNISTPQKAFSCAIKKYGLHINSAFELMPCPESKFYNYHTKLVDEEFDVALCKIREFVEGFSEMKLIGCAGCEYQISCKMCPAKANKCMNKNSEIIGFEVPEGYCEKFKKKWNAIKINTSC